MTTDIRTASAASPVPEWRHRLEAALVAADRVNRPLAMALATVCEGKPYVRMVGFQGFAPNTNVVRVHTLDTSRKVRHGEFAECCVHLPSQSVQVRIRGKFGVIFSTEKNAKLFAARDRLWEDLSDFAKGLYNSLTAKPPKQFTMLTIEPDEVDFMHKGSVVTYFRDTRALDGWSRKG